MNNSMRWTMWGIVKGLISTTKLYGFQESAKIIAEQLEGETPLEKLAHFELGEKNRMIMQEGDKVLVVLKQCPFAQVYREMPEWGGEESCWSGSMHILGAGVRCIPFVYCIVMSGRI